MTPSSELSRTCCTCLHLALHIMTQLRCRHLVLTVAAPSYNNILRKSMLTNTTPHLVGWCTFSIPKLFTDIAYHHYENNLIARPYLCVIM